MDTFLKGLRGSVRPVLAYLFAGAFIALVLWAFGLFGSQDLADKLIAAFVPVVGIIAALYFQSRNQTKPPENKPLG
jgi:hypothetical protein